MLCGGAAEHQLALISDAAEITDTHPTPPDEVQSCEPLRRRQTHTQKNVHFANFPIKKMEESTAGKTSVMSIANLK